jgi:hypothetical protein
MNKSINFIAKWACALALVFCSFSFSNAQTTHTIPDDGYVHVPLQFGFPYYGGVFTNSWMFDNGVVGFLDPTTGGNGGQQYWAEPFRNDIGPRFHYMIAPLWTDLVNYGSGSFITEGTNQFQRYTWQNISQWGYPDRLNTFSLEIRPTGYIGVNYEMINVQGYPVSTGTIGNATLGEWAQKQYLDGSQSLGLTLPNWSINDTVVDQCILNPLSSPTCSGHTEAMCATNPLFSTSCSGYQQAYFSQQCSVNSLYDPYCPGYAAAYLSYMCSVDALYSTTCEGYEQAYFDQQCLLNGLYSRQCPNYNQSYAENQLLNQQADVKSETETSVATTHSSVNTGLSPSTNPANPLAVVQLIQPTISSVALETRQESKDASSSNTSSTTNTSSASADNKTETKPTARQQLQARREAAARAKAVEDGKSLASTVGNATDMEQQKAVQNVIISAMGFVPGFDAYSQVMIVQTPFYKPEQVYKNQTNVDNALIGRRMFGGTDKTHSDMVDSQYQLGK